MLHTGMTETNEAIEMWCGDERWCPITVMATLIGKKWHPVVLHCLLVNQPCGFSELRDHVDGISGKVLSELLADLEENRLVEREVINDRPFRVHYMLTNAGKALEPVLETMREWGKEYVAPPNEQRGAPVMSWSGPSE